MKLSSVVSLLPEMKAFHSASPRPVAKRTRGCFDVDTPVAHRFLSPLSRNTTFRSSGLLALSSTCWHIGTLRVDIKLARFKEDKVFCTVGSLYNQKTCFT